MFTPEQQIMFLSAKVNPSPKEIACLDTLLTDVKDWEILRLLLTNRAAAPLFYIKLSRLKNQNLIPENIQSMLIQTYYKVMRRNILIYNAFVEIAKLCAKRGIKLVALKGVYLAEKLYGDIALRQMSDIDLLVNETDGKAVLEILNSLGYRAKAGIISDFVKSRSGIVHYDPMLRDNIIVELHVNLHYKNRNYQMDTVRVIKNAIPVEIQNCPIYSLDLYDTLVYCCLHADKHFGETGQTQFTVFYDLVNMLELWKKQIDWTELENRCAEYRATETVFKYLLLAENKFNAHIPKEFFEKHKLLLNNKLQKTFHKNLQKINLNQYTGIHLATLRNMNIAGERLHYLFDALFPPKSFMIKKYRIKNPKFFWLYYPKRHFKAIKSFFK